MTYDEQLRTPEWKEKAKSIKERDKHRCQTCFSVLDLEVHHKAYISGRMAWEYEDEYLITLCDTCHKKVHSLPIANDVSLERGEPFEPDPYQEQWLQIKRGLQGLAGLNRAIATRELESRYKKDQENG